MTWDTLFKNNNNIWDKPAPIVEEYITKWKRLNIKTIADVGCGGGRHTIFSAQHELKVFALDVSDTALNKVSKVTQDLNLHKKISIDKIVSNIIPLNDNTCDAAISISAIHHGTYQDVIKSLTEIHRILVNNGKFLLVVPSTDHPTYGSGEEIEKNTYITDKGIDKGVPHHFFTKQSLNNILEKTSYTVHKINSIGALEIAGINNGHLMALVEAKK